MEEQQPPDTSSGIHLSGLEEYLPVLKKPFIKIPALVFFRYYSPVPVNMHRYKAAMHRCLARIHNSLEQNSDCYTPYVEKFPGFGHRIMSIIIILEEV